MPAPTNPPTTPPPTQLTKRLTEAVEFARVAHEGQLRKGTAIPYLAHPLAVCALALTFGATEDEAIAALLHDAAEDGGGQPRLHEIRLQFGETVADLVNGCSDSLSASREDKLPWRERKETHLAHLREGSRSLLLVTAADKLHNLQSLLSDHAHHGEALWSRFNAPKADQLWYYQACRDVLTANPEEPWCDPLCEAVAALGRVTGGGAA